MPAAAEAILALLVLLQQPGRSPYSTVLVPDCDEQCRQTPVCGREMLSCAPPKWSPRRQSFYRLETYAEGLNRYADIAEVVGEVAAESRRWLGSRQALEHLLLTVAYHESGFRRDVHEGRTRGDCEYHQVAGVREPIPGSCRSHCLGQIFLMPEERTPRGYAEDDLVGLDRASTKRCVETMADKLAESNRACNVQRGKAGTHAACTMGMYGGVASYGRDARIAARVRTFERLRFVKASLPAEAAAVLSSRSN